MGVLNVTPDSFSDGGMFMDPASAVDQALRMVSEGAGIIDVGGESTRPRAIPVEEAEERRRVIPVIEKLAGKIPVPISIDTMKTAVAAEALRAGASMINDVGANQHKPEMWRLAAETGCAYVCMHMRGSPQTMQVDPVYQDVTGEVETFFLRQLKELDDCGVLRDQIILDPGIGFGKTAAHNVQLLADLVRFAAIGRPLLVGVSRKSFLGALDGAPPEARLPAGLACACLAVESGAWMIRTHDVAQTLQAVRMTEAIMQARRGKAEEGEPRLS
jgi:dihydropteroate synthase